MSASARSTKDKEMAANLKARGEKRTTARCPMCHAIVGIDRAMYSHLSTHGHESNKDD